MSRARGARPQPWWMPAAERLGAALLALLAATWRLERVAMAERDARLAAGERCVYAFWHARMLPMVVTHRHLGVAVLVSRHHDGELIARILARFGFETARGSSTRGGEEGMRDLLRFAEQRRSLAITPDGPRGPAERVKPGLAFVASRSGFPVLPVTSAASRAWVGRSWDRFRVPMPFARVVVAYGDLIAVPPGLDGAALEPWTRRIEEAIAALTESARRRAGEAA